MAIKQIHLNSRALADSADRAMERGGRARFCPLPGAAPVVDVRKNFRVTGRALLLEYLDLLEQIEREEPGAAPPYSAAGGPNPDPASRGSIGPADRGSLGPAATYEYGSLGGANPGTRR